MKQLWPSWPEGLKDKEEEIILENYFYLAVRKNKLDKAIT